MSILNSGEAREELPPAAAVLNFWFGGLATDASTYPERRKLWFGKAPDFDRQIQTQFEPLYWQAAANQLDAWAASPLSCLALVIVLDQFPRNLFRQSPQTYAADALALDISQQALAQGFDRSLTPVQRVFLYLPLEHSEAATDQARSVELFEQLQAIEPALKDTYDYALKHQAVIDRFGRFPHRNAILGRETTIEEAEFLKQPGSSF